MEDLIMAALCGKDGRVRELLAAGANVNHADGNGWTALSSAAGRGHDDIVARQLREAAMKETDPELRARLWEEYRQYKKGSS